MLLVRLYIHITKMFPPESLKEYKVSITYYKNNVL